MLAEAVKQSYRAIEDLPTTETTAARRGIRHGALTGMVAGACVAHALTLVGDYVWGIGPFLTPHTWAHHQKALRGRAPGPADSHHVFGAPRGLIGPPVAAFVGAAAGTASAVGNFLGFMAGLVSSPIVALQPARPQRLQAHMRSCRETAEHYSFAVVGASAAIVTAVACDTARLPGVCLKVAVPLIGFMAGACLGSLNGIFDLWNTSVTQGVRASAVLAFMLGRAFGPMWVAAGILSSLPFSDAPG